MCCTNYFSDDSNTALSCIDYGSIINTAEQFQSYFDRARRGSKYLAKAIREGFRKEELLPAIMRDFQCWMFVRLDLSKVFFRKVKH